MDKRLTVHRDGVPIYDIVLSGSFDELADEVSRLDVGCRRLCIVTDSNVAALYLETVSDILKDCCRSLTSFVFHAGEEYKNLDTVRDLYLHLIGSQFDRKDMLVALGGGVVGDLCGYAAATYLRGISFIQIPTTLLSQVDSSIGGKTGVDVDAYKNMVGAFHMPALVYTNVSTLKTLPPVQYSSGMGEIIKHGLIRDIGYYEWLGANRDQILRKDEAACMAMIRRSDEIKQQIVEADPTEKGERALLNLGHTLGHAIEKMADFTLPHGHCVGLGLLAAAEISRARRWIGEEDIIRLKNLLMDYDIPVSVSGQDADAVLAATKNDKKMDGGKIRFILLRSVGDAVIDKTVTDDEMRAALNTILL